MTNNNKSILSGIAGILLILSAVQDELSTFNSVMLVVGVILLAIGSTIADRDRELKKEAYQEELMKELHDAVNRSVKRPIEDDHEPVKTTPPDIPRS
jgi:hypothetical protein